MSPNLTWSVRAGYNSKSSWFFYYYYRTTSTASSKSYKLLLIPSIYLTARSFKFIRQSFWDSLLDLLVASFGKLFHDTKDFGANNIILPLLRTRPSRPRTNHSAPLLALKQYWRELRAICCELSFHVLFLIVHKTWFAVEIGLQPISHTGSVDLNL